MRPSCGPSGKQIDPTKLFLIEVHRPPQLCAKAAVFDDFCHANDPHHEHDFGSFDADEHTIFFKIDCYDKALSMHSPDPSDPSVTERVITIMLSEEY
jgi:hypothetical protein